MNRLTKLGIMLAAAIAIIFASDCAFADGDLFNPPPRAAVLSSARTLVIYGDSITANADSNYYTATPCTTGCFSKVYTTYMTWASIYSNYRLFRAPNTNNCGYSGYVATQILAAIGCPLGSGADVVLMEGGGNDASNGVTCASAKATYRQIYAQLLAAGKTVIKVGIYPRSGSSAFTTAAANVAQCLNDADRRYAEETGNANFYFVDLDPVVLDPTQSIWAIKSGYLESDGQHPSQVGGSAEGYAVAQVINQIVPNWRVPLVTDGDTYDATNNPAGNLLPNGAMTGTTGSVSGCTGTAPTGITVTASLGGATCVIATTTLSDGRSAMTITLSGSYTGSNLYVSVSQPVGTPGNINVGDVLDAGLWLNIGSNAIGGVLVRHQITDGGTNYYYDGSNNDASYEPWPTGGMPDSAQHTVVTPRRTVAGTVTGDLLLATIGFQNEASSTPISGTITISSMWERKVLP